MGLSCAATAEEPLRGHFQMRLENRFSFHGRGMPLSAKREEGFFCLRGWRRRGCSLRDGPADWDTCGPPGHGLAQALGGRDPRAKGLAGLPGEWGFSLAVRVGVLSLCLFPGAVQAHLGVPVWSVGRPGEGHLRGAGPGLRPDIHAWAHR